MEFKIEIDDFWLDEEDELEPALKNHITNAVVSKINKQIEEKVDDTITRQVKQQVEKQLLKKTNKLIDDFIKNGKMNGEYSSDPEVSVEEYIKQKFERKNGWGDPRQQIAKLAEGLGKELKNRYDLLFATQIVKKLDHEGLLKDNVAKMILEENGNEKNT